MKIMIKQILSAVLLVLSSSVFMSGALADGNFTTGVIEKIDMKKKIIYFHKAKYYFDNKTVVNNVAGKQYKVSDLSTGLTVSVSVDPKRRYISFPTLKSLRLMSAIED